MAEPDPPPMDESGSIPKIKLLILDSLAIPFLSSGRAGFCYVTSPLEATNGGRSFMTTLITTLFPMYWARWRDATGSHWQGDEGAESGVMPDGGCCGLTLGEVVQRGDGLMLTAA